MACECIDMINGELGKQNGRLEMVFSWSGGAWPSLGVEKVDRKKRQKPPCVIPTYCPFCGTKYRDEHDNSPKPAEREERSDDPSPSPNTERRVR